MNTFFARTHLIGLTCVAAFLLGCSSKAPKRATSLQPANLAVADIQINDPKPYPFRFVAYGDMRFAEHESYGGVGIANAKARQQVIDQIAKEVPAFLVVTGDFVFRGFQAEDWTYFDKAIKPVRDAGIRIFPAIGNHEVMGPIPAKLYGPEVFKEIEEEPEEHVIARSLENYYKDFPDISHKPWYSVRYANCYFLVLDSEAGDEVSTSAQDQWIRAQLDAIPPDVDYIFVSLHRPPYTDLHDKVHTPGPAQIALSKTLEARQQNSRARIVVIAGHVHNYERFQHGGVMYVVSGGGGAKLVEIARSADDLYPQNPLYGKNDPPNEDQYHYCVLTVDHSKLNFQMMKLVTKGNSATFEARDAFELNAAAH